MVNILPVAPLGTTDQVSPDYAAIPRSLMPEPDQDAIAFLQQQHDQARSLLNGLASGASDRDETFKTLVRLLAVHETAESLFG